MKYVLSILSCMSLMGACSALGEEQRSSKIGSTEYWQQLFAKQDTVDYPIVFIHGIGGGFQ